MWHQQTLTLGPKSRGFHLVTNEIIGQIRELSHIKVGLLHLLLQHTSASLTLNENCDPTVRFDMEQHFLNAVPDNAPYEHDYEGPDDMPSHIKSSLLGVSLMLPVQNGNVMLGTRQGIWLGSIVFTAVRGILSQRSWENKKMTISDLLLYCMAKPGAEQSVHSDWKATQIKVADVLFAMVKEVEDKRPAVALKTSPELAELLREQHRDVRPSRHLNKSSLEHGFPRWLSARFADLLSGGCFLSTGGRPAVGG